MTLSCIPRDCPGRGCFFMSSNNCFFSIQASTSPPSGEVPFDASLHVRQSATLISLAFVGTFTIEHPTGDLSSHHVARSFLPSVENFLFQAMSRSACLQRSSRRQRLARSFFLWMRTYVSVERVLYFPPASAVRGRYVFF